MTEVHTTAAKGFETKDLAKHYDSIRPSFTKDSISFMNTLLVQNKDNVKILELGAGTGIQTKWLADFDCEIVTTEPVEGMFETLKDNVEKLKVNRSKKITAIQSTAEEIPLDDNSIDGVFVGQAFHWFNAEPACKEIHRVLKKDGFLVLAWNIGNADGSIPWYQECERVIVLQQPRGTPQFRDLHWKLHFDKSTIKELFPTLEFKKFPNYVACTREKLIARILSTSFIAIMDKEKRDNEVVNPVLEICDNHNLPEDFEYPYESIIYFAKVNK